MAALSGDQDGGGMFEAGGNFTHFQRSIEALGITMDPSLGRVLRAIAAPS